MTRTNSPHWFVSALCVSAVALGACSTTQWREKADRETYGIIEAKTPAVPNMERDFTIDEAPLESLDGLPVVTEADPAMGELADTEVGAYRISLEQALALAVRHNRDYQARKESLYLSALGLTLDRHAYTPIFSAGGRVDYNHDTNLETQYTPRANFFESADDIVTEIGGVVGTPADLLTRYAALVEGAVNVSELDQPSEVVVDEDSVSGSTNVGVSWLLKGGGLIAVDLTSNFLRFLTGDPGVSTDSALIASFTQPLLRGAGSKAAAERLTQSERDVLYAMRNYTRYRKEFTVSTVAAYYSVLQARDAVRNNYQSYLAFRRSAERDRAMVEEGRRKRSDLGRTEQAELQSQNQWTNSVRRYRETLDRFKIALGLPVDARVVMDSAELNALREDGLDAWTLAPEEAAEVALAARLDLYNARDALEDATRKAEIAANALLPDVDLVAAGSVNSEDGDRFQELDWRRAAWNVGLDVDLPLDRKAERNAFRSALISEERARRDLELAVDNVKLDVRDAWRALDQARVDYEIQLLSVRLNETRVDEAQMLMDLGRGSALDLVDAQNALTASRNQLTEAIVAHTVARLAYWRDMGILYIKQDGQWEDVTDEPA